MEKFKLLKQEMTVAAKSRSIKFQPLTWIICFITTDRHSMAICIVIIIHQHYKRCQEIQKKIKEGTERGKKPLKVCFTLRGRSKIFADCVFFNFNRFKIIQSLSCLAVNIAIVL